MISFFKSEPSYIPPGAFGGGKPLPQPRVVNTDFYRGKVKSIYEREPLFQVPYMMNDEKLRK